ILGLVLDKHLLAVEAYAWLSAAHAPAFGIILGDKKQRMNIKWGIRAEMQPQAWLIKCATLELVKLGVFLVRYILLIFKPDSLYGVHPRAIERDGEWHKAGIAGEDIFYLPL